MSKTPKLNPEALSEPIVEFLEHDQEGQTQPGPEVTSELIVRGEWEETMRSLANKPGTTVRVPRSPSLKREQVVNAFLDAFELIGGTPRLAIWGDENPTEFYKLWSKLAPRQIEQETTHDGGLRIQHVLPRGPLDE